MCGPFESALSLDDCLSFAAQLLLLFLMNTFMDPQMNALLGFHFQLDSICSKMFNESIWGCVDGHLPNNLDRPSETKVMLSVLFCGHDQVRHTLVCSQ